MTKTYRNPIARALGLPVAYSDRRKDGSQALTFRQDYDRWLTKASVEVLLYRADIGVQKIRVYGPYIKIRTQEPVDIW
jgi:hypothetical protein